MNYLYSLHGLPITLSSEDEGFLKFFEEFRKGWALKPLNSSKERGGIFLSINDGEGKRFRLPRGSKLLYKYFPLSAYSSPDGLHLLKGNSYHMYLKPEQGYAKGWIARGSMTFDSFARVFSLVLSELLSARGLFYLHSACLSDRSGNGWLICGWPRSGKTTLSLGFIKAGFSYLSDDAVLLKRVGRGRVESLSLRKALRIKSKNGGKRSLLPESISAGSYVEQCIPAVLIHASLNRKRNSSLVPLAASRAFLDLIPQSFQILSSMTAKEHSSVLKDLSSQCVSFALHAGTDLLRSPERLIPMIREKGVTADVP